MAPTIKIELTEEEYKKVLLEAYDNNCPTIKEYLRLKWFHEAPSYDYEDLLFQIEIGIEALEVGGRFQIRDLITETNWTDIPLSVRKILERMYLQYILNGRGYDVIKVEEKDSHGIQWYKKQKKTTMEELSILYGIKLPHQL